MAEERVRITVQVQPNAQHSEVLGFANGVLRVRVAAPPVKGRANKELIDLLSRLLDINKDCIAIEKGQTSKRKLIAISGLSQVEVVARLGG